MALTGIIGAMDTEMKLLVSLLEEDQTQTVSRIVFHRGKLYGKDVVLAVSGVGIGFAAAATEAMILLYHPDRIINIGVAGTLTPALSIGDMAIARSVVQHDMDTTAVGDPVGMISGINMVHLPCDNTLRRTIMEIAGELGIRALFGTIASGDQFVATPAEKTRISKTYGAVACEMEGSGVALVCFINQVPCAVIRSISDNADAKGEEGLCLDYESFKQMAADQSARVLYHLLQKL